MRERDDRGRSGFRQFWSSLPGVLTGIAAVIGAVGTIAALFVGKDDDPAPAAGTQQAAPAQRAAPGGDRCLRRYFEGIPGDRVGSVEAGTTAYDVIRENQTKRGPIGLTFTLAERPIGAMRFALIAENRVFRIDSLVDARCRPVAYENPQGGAPNVVQDSGTVRFQLAGGSYDLTTVAWGSAVRVQFIPVVP